MLKNGQTYFKCDHRKIFKACLAIFQHYEMKGYYASVILTKFGVWYLKSCNQDAILPWGRTIQCKEKVQNKSSPDVKND